MSHVSSKQTSIATISLRTDGIYEYRFIDEYVVERVHMDEMLQTLKELSQGETSIRLVTIPGRYGSIANDAKTYDPLAADAPLVGHIALVLPSLHQKILARAYYKFVKKPPYNYQFFKNEESAIEWLQEARQSMKDSVHS